jgi:hypothetical protein
MITKTVTKPTTALLVSPFSIFSSFSFCPSFLRFLLMASRSIPLFSPYLPLCLSVSLLAADSELKGMFELAKKEKEKDNNNNNNNNRDKEKNSNSINFNEFLEMIAVVEQVRFVSSLVLSRCLALCLRVCSPVSVSVYLVFSSFSLLFFGSVIHCSSSSFLFFPFFFFFSSFLFFFC